MGPHHDRNLHRQPTADSQQPILPTLPTSTAQEERTGQLEEGSQRRHVVSSVVGPAHAETPETAQHRCYYHHHHHVEKTGQIAATAAATAADARIRIPTGHPSSLRSQISSPARLPSVPVASAQHKSCRGHCRSGCAAPRFAQNPPAKRVCCPDARKSSKKKEQK